jgi:hypothetical protein
MPNFIKSLKKTKCYLRTERALDFISLGKFQTILFLQRKNARSSAFGGLLTLVWVIAILAFSYLTLAAVFEESTFYLSSKSRVLSYFEVKNQTVPLK